MEKKFVMTSALRQRQVRKKRMVTKKSNDFGLTFEAEM